MSPPYASPNGMKRLRSLPTRSSRAAAEQGGGGGKRICSRISNQNNETSTPAKRRSSLSGEDPDPDPACTLVIGGTEFQETRWELRLWSGYFDAAYRSGMKESQTGRFELPHRNPDEWLTIKDILDPFSAVSITASNVDMALSWFDELCILQGIQACEQVLCKRQQRRHYSTPREIDELMSDLSLSRKHNFAELKVRCLGALQGLWKNNGHYQLTLPQIKSLLGAIGEHGKDADTAWNLIKPYMLLDAQSMERDVLLKNPLLASLVFQGIQQERAESQMRRTISTIQAESKGHVSNLKHRLASRHELKGVFPDHWCRFDPPNFRR